MTGTPDFDTYTRLLREGAERTPGVRSLVLLGSASEASRARRDEWSDHDFYALLEPGTEQAVRAELAFLPSREHIVLIAAEGSIGFSVLWDDGHLFEFGIGTAEELGAVGVDTAQLLVDPHGDGAELVDDARRRRAGATLPTAEDATGLALVKLLVGFGRARRGEVLSGGAFVRGHAIPQICHAVRMRQPRDPGAGDPFDPLRRFESDYPDAAAALAAALALPVEDAARTLLRFLRTELEPGWPGFPSAAADAVEARLAVPS